MQAICLISGPDFYCDMTESEKMTFFQQLSISLIFSEVRKVEKLQFLGLNKGIGSVMKNKNKNFHTLSKMSKIMQNMNVT